MTHPRQETRLKPAGDLALVLFSFDLDILEVERMTTRGVHIVIVHRYAQTEECAPGEEIAAAWIVYRGKPYQIPLSTTHLILFDYLCRHRGVAQTATQIAHGLSNELFYTHHAANAKGARKSSPRTSRTAVKEQIARLRATLRTCVVAARIPLTPAAVLHSIHTSSNEVRYSICAVVRWEHWSRDL